MIFTNHCGPATMRATAYSSSSY
uniref:Uncharacterized protein n=1 Tax=Musa acuminata subsp. malaccensis TaxID=214687 RepID=A0A804HX07_MUSAM